jgi:hypothetical protein
MKCLYISIGDVFIPAVRETNPKEIRSVKYRHKESIRDSEQTGLRIRKQKVNKLIFNVAFGAAVTYTREVIETCNRFHSSLH